jgi:hypothetical protein
MEKVEPKEEPKPEPVQRIYVGPSDKARGLRQYAIFNGELPAFIQSHVDRDPIVAHNLIPLEDFAKQTAPGTPPRGTRQTAAPKGTPFLKR